MKSYASIDSFTKGPALDEYYKTVTDFSTILTGQSFLMVMDALKLAKSHLDSVKNLDSNTLPYYKGQVADSMKYYLKTTKTLKTLLDDFEKEVPLWKKFYFLGNVDSLKTLEPLEEMVRIFNLHHYLLTAKKTEDKYQVSKEFSEISKLVDPSKKAEKMLTLMNGLIRSKGSLNGRSGGVPGLKLLADSIQKDWIEKALSHVGKTHQIVKGLQPIISLGSKLESLDAILERIPGPEFLKSFRTLEVFQKLVVKLPPGFETSVDFAENYNECLENNQVHSLKVVILKSLVNDARTLHNSIRHLRRSGFLEKDIKDTHREMEKLGNVITFTDPQDDEMSKEEVLGIYEKMMSDGSLPRVKELLSTIFKSLEGFTVEDVQKNAENILKRKPDIETYWTEPDLTNEDKASECMKALDNSEQASNAAKAVIDLQKIQPNQMQAVKTALNLCSKFAKGLKDLNFNSIVENMKREVTDETSKLNEMTPYSFEGITGSNIITKAASMLQDSYEFVEFKSRLSQLDVDIEIDKLTLQDPIILKSIENQWGSQKTFVDQLIKNMEEVEKFHSSVRSVNITTFGDYGAPLKRISFGKIGEGLEQKSNALESSWPYNGNSEEKMKQEMAKNTMDEMAVLDLNFASHKTEFDGAQEVLEHLQTFLTQFIDEIKENQAVEDGQISTTVIIIIGAVAFLVLIGMIVLTYMGCTHKGCFKTLIKESHSTEYKYIRNGQIVPKSQQCIWLNNLTYFQPQDAYNTHANYVTTMKIADNNFFISTANSIPERKHALPETIKFKNRNLMATRGYHGNKIVTRTGTIFYAVQAPMAADATHDDTQEDFWDLTWNDGAEFIIMLNRIFDGLDGPNGVRYTNLARYFPTADREGPGRTITIGKYTLTEITSTNENYEDDRLHRDFTVRVIEITRTVGGRFSRRSETRCITHYQHNHWEEDGVPRNGFQAMYDVMRAVRQSKKPIIVHCNTGTDRTMAFIGMEYIPRLIEVDTEQNYITLFTKLAEHRYGAFGTVRISYTLQLGVIFFMVMDLDLFVTFEPHRTMYERVVTNQEGVPREGRRGNVVF